MAEPLLQIAARVLSCCAIGTQPNPRDVITLRLKTPYPESNLPTEELARIIVQQESSKSRSQQAS
jgi:hypothetical protein